MTKKDMTKLDLVFILDTTSSMGPYINAAKQGINNIFDAIIKAEACHLRIGLVNYRDHPPQDLTYVTQVFDLTDDLTNIKSNISSTTHCGGGDLPEAICCGLEKSLNDVTWRSDSVKIAVLIADAPPHGLGLSCGDSFPYGCPLKHDPVDIAHRMAEKEIALYCAGCEPAILPYKNFFNALTLITGGQYMPLSNHNDLAKLIINGAHDEVSIEKLMVKIQDDLEKEAAKNGIRINEDELTKRINNLLETRGSDISRSLMSDSLEITDKIKELAKQKNLYAFKEFASINKISLTTYKDEITKPLHVISSSDMTPVRVITNLKSTEPRKTVSSTKIKLVKNKLHKVFDVRRSLRLAVKHKKFGSRFEFLIKNKRSLRRSQRLRNISVVQKNIDQPKRNQKILNKPSIETVKFSSSDSSLEILSRRIAKKSIARSNKCL